MDALRTADGTLITTEDIALRVIKANGFDAADAALRKAFGEQTLAILRMFRKQGRVDKIGLGRGCGRNWLPECAARSIRFAGELNIMRRRQ
jgi:hypothetical protein